MDISTLAQRLKIAMAEQGLSQSSLAEKVGMSQAAIQKITSGKAKTTGRIIEIAHALNVSPYWLQVGVGEMRSETASQIVDVNKNPNSEIAPTRLRAAVWEDLEVQDKDEFVEIPLIDVKFSAGPGTYEVIDSEGFSLIFRRYSLHKMGVSPASAKLVRVSGDSMYPALNDGDVVGINTSDTQIRDGKTYAICHDDVLRIKTLVSKPGEVVIRSLNRDLYPDEAMDTVKFHKEIRVIGKVFWSSHSW